MAAAAILDFVRKKSEGKTVSLHRLSVLLNNTCSNLCANECNSDRLVDSTWLSLW